MGGGGRVVVRGGKKRERSPKGERRRIVIVAVVYVALFFAVATFSCCLALPCSQAESTEDITVVHQTLETAHLRAPRARAPPAEPERANKTGGDGIGEQASRGNKPKAKRRNECIHKTIRNKQHSCALRAARSTSIARLHQRLDASRQSAAQRAKQRHAILRHGKKKAATASQRCSRRDLARDRMDLGDFQRFFTCQRRQDCRKPARQHGFSTAWWSNQKRVMPTGGGDFKSALGNGLSFDFGKIKP